MDGFNHKILLKAKWSGSASSVDFTAELGLRLLYLHHCHLNCLLFGSWQTLDWETKVISSLIFVFAQEYYYEPLLSRFNPISVGAGIAVPTVGMFVFYIGGGYAGDPLKLCHKYVTYIWKRLSFSACWVFLLHSENENNWTSPDPQLYNLQKPWT
jgi:hypothetical protein